MLKEQSKMNNTEKLAAHDAQDEEKQNKNCWTPLHANKLK